jgi:acyl-CoA reductase-like NAD-dependent aldehyde dehydrogenase
VWPSKASTALQVVHNVHSGTMWVNCCSLIDPMVGFSGTKLSDYGSKGTAAHMDGYLDTKASIFSSEKVRLPWADAGSPGTSSDGAGH